MRITLLVHIVAGGLGLLSGYVALSAAKGAALHRKSGILFVCVMLVMSVTGMLISAVEGVAPAINVPSALLTFYLVTTGLMTVRPPAAWSRRFDLGAMMMALGIGLTCIALGLAAIAAGGAQAGMAFPLFLFAVVALISERRRSAGAASGRPSGRASTRTSSLAHVFRAVHRVDRILCRRKPGSRGASHACSPRNRSLVADRRDVVLVVAPPETIRSRRRSRQRTSHNCGARFPIMHMHTNQLPSRKPLRLWPGVAFAIVLIVGRYVIPVIAPPEAEIFSLPLGLIAMFAGMLAAVGILAWWLFFSRAPWSERLGAIILMAIAVVALKPIVDVSVRTGNMGYMLIFYSIPILSLAIVVWAVATRRLPDGLRRVSLVAAMVLAAVPFALIRTAGVSGTGAELHWRWTPTPEDRLLAEAKDEPVAVVPPPAAAPPAAEPKAEIPVESPATKTADKPIAAPEAPAALPKAAATTKAEPAPRAATETPAEWPGFRGPNRDSIIRGVRINTDWTASPPVTDVAPADWTGLVILCGPRRSSLHAGAARGRRGRGLLTRCPRANLCGGTAIGYGSGNRMPAPVHVGHRRSATVASTHSAQPES